MLPKTRHGAQGARRLRSGALTLTLAAFVPLAIPVTASASTFPGGSPAGAFFGYPAGNEFFNQVNAYSATDAKTVFKVKFGLGEGAGPVVTAVNRAVAFTTECANCTAIAIGFQIVTTTDQDLADLRATNFANATNKNCTGTCDSVADAYQVVVATDTTQPMGFGQLLSKQQLNALDQLRSQFLALPNSGLTPTQIEAQCQDLVGQAVDILQQANSAGPDSGPPSYNTPPVPSFSPVVYGGGTAAALTGDGQPVVNLYHEFENKPFWKG